MIPYIILAVGALQRLVYILSLRKTVKRARDEGEEFTEMHVRHQSS